MDAKNILIGGGILILGLLAYETAKADEYNSPPAIGTMSPFQAVVCDTEAEVKVIATAGHTSWDDASKAYWAFYHTPNSKGEPTCSNMPTPPLKVISEEKLDTLEGAGGKTYMAWAVKATFPDGSDYWMMVAMKPVESDGVKI